jgi:hypothetical protein
MRFKPVQQHPIAVAMPILDSQATMNPGMEDATPKSVVLNG